MNFFQELTDQTSGLSLGVEILIFIVAIILLVFLFSSIRVVKEYERIVVFRFGRALAEKGPGIVFILPKIDVPVTVDLREKFLTVPHQTCITKDNTPVDVDFIIYFKVVNASNSVIQVQDFEGAALGIATTTLRAVIGDIMLDEVLSKRENINAILRTKLDEVTTRWGVKITNVEIREIVPPKNVQDAMVLQMSAERNRRAVVTEAEGKKAAAITVAEGEKQSNILRAEGERQSNILRAEGERQAAILGADGYALALTTIYNAAKQIDNKTLALQYLDALKKIGSSPSTKYVIPMEFTELVKPFTETLKGAKDNNTEQ